MADDTRVERSDVDKMKRSLDLVERAFSGDTDTLLNSVAAVGAAVIIILKYLIKKELEK